MDEQPNDEMLVDDKKSGICVMIIVTFFSSSSRVHVPHHHNRLREIISFAQVNSIKLTEWEFGFHAYYLPIAHPILLKNVRIKHSKQMQPRGSYANRITLLHD